MVPRTQELIKCLAFRVTQLMCGILYSADATQFMKVIRLVEMLMCWRISTYLPEFLAIIVMQSTHCYSNVSYRGSFHVSFKYNQLCIRRHKNKLTVHFASIQILACLSIRVKKLWQ